LAGELGLLLLFAVGWELVGDQPTHTAQALLLAVAAAAMGIQSTAIRRLGEMSTTYLTSTLTGLIEALRIRHWTDANARSLAILAAAVIGAAGATALLGHHRGWVPALQLLPLGIAIFASRRLQEPRVQSKPT
jgi:hypothetical protein